MDANLGHVLLIANPAAQNGNGAKAIEAVVPLLREALGDRNVVLARTVGPHHATDLAKRAQGADTVIALGGDGVIHEIVNGLMQRDGFERPALGVIPVGSGNDFARSLGISSRPDIACDQILRGCQSAIDMGCANGQWFMETLSFGLDAAIAIDTMERRKKSGRSGAALYMESGFDQLLHHLDSYRYTASFDGGEPVSGESITFAVQNGPYYGGGFKICPEARLDDGVLDLCIAHPPVSVAKAIYLFLRAKGGGHVGFRNIEMLRCTTAHIEFEQQPPAQVDGEKLQGRVFDVRLDPASLRVIAPLGQ